jgi:uncharacterized protein (DUF2141 family)
VLTISTPASGNVTLNIPSPIVPETFSQQYPFSLDLGLTTSAGTQSLVGYDLYLEVAGSSGLTITGVGTGSNHPANAIFSDDPSFADETDQNVTGTLYYFGDFSSSAGTITTTTNLLRVEASLAAGTTSGTYQISAYLSSSDSMTTDFYSGINTSGVPVLLTGWTQEGGTINVAGAGDVNCDGKVDVNDLTIVLSHFGQTAGMTWTTGDLNGDGRVDVNDLTIVLSNFGKSSGAGIGAVPEPSCLLLLGVGAAGLFAYIRRRRTQRP